MGNGRPDRRNETGRVVAFPGSRSLAADLETVFREQQGRLLQFLRIRLRSEVEAQDLAQLTFLRLWKRRDSLNNENLEALIFVTARNLAFDHLRQRTRKGRTSLDAGGEWDEAATIEDQAAGAERVLSAKQDLALVAKLVDELPAKCRSAFVSYHFHHQSYLQIADQLGVTESMARKYVLKAVAHCAIRFEQLEGWE